MKVLAVVATVPQFLHIRGLACGQ